MTRADDDEAALLRGLARRIAQAGPPSWPVPIFEAESYLYRFFVRRLFALLRAAFDRKMSAGEVGSLVGTPTVVAELGYLLFGADHSDLTLSERSELAVILAGLIRALRPTDPFCELGQNRHIVVEEFLPQQPELRAVSTDRDRRGLNHLTTSLFALVELLQVGVPQYSREISGPWPSDSGHFMLVRDYFGLRPVDVWPFADGFPYDRIRIAEIFSGAPEEVHFDLTNHLSFLKPPGPALHQASVYGYSGRWEPIADWFALVEVVTENVVLGTRFTSSFSRVDWLRKHLEMRYLTLSPLAKHLDFPWVPEAPEIAHLLDPASAYENLKPVLAGTFEQIFGHLCREVGLGSA